MQYGVKIKVKLVRTFMVHIHLNHGRKENNGVILQSPRQATRDLLMKILIFFKVNQEKDAMFIIKNRI